MINNDFLDVARYPDEFLKVDSFGVHAPAAYRNIWDDGFGARGWKLNAAIGDPAIIASKRYTGERIDTSVFVHDVLDHLLCGFAASGYRSEAMALMQLASRTGSDPGPDFEQMVMEDIINGEVNGENLPMLLPSESRSLSLSQATMTDTEIMAFLLQPFQGAN